MGLGFTQLKGTSAKAASERRQCVRGSGTVVDGRKVTAAAASPQLLLISLVSLGWSQCVSLGWSQCVRLENKNRSIVFGVGWVDSMFGVAQTYSVELPCTSMFGGVRVYSSGVTLRTLLRSRTGVL